jgi:hypothetical protein
MKANKGKILRKPKYKEVRVGVENCSQQKEGDKLG